MSRSQPYRPRIPTHIIQLMDVASRITLFLVGQSGPLCFTFKDRLDNKYKTSIGPELKCSCAPGKNDHCIHTAYIFLKVFKVSVDNPIIWQAAYVDSQLSDLLAWKHTLPEVRRPRPAFQDLNFSLPELPSQWLKRKEKKDTKAVIVLSERMKLQADSICPICQEAMSEEMCLSFCKVRCGNNFHLECLKIWARHRIQQDANVSCPMCRCPFPETITHQLQEEEKQWARKQSQKIKIQFNCAGCGLKNIPNNPHKCILCTAYELCQCCYAANKHVKHPFMRRDGDGRWRGAEERRQDQLKIKNYIESKRKETYNEDILKRLRKIDEDPSKLIDYVASAYPYVSRYISQKVDPLKKLDFDPTDIRCLKCGGTRMLFLRRLACGHFIDHECLKDNILKQKYYCLQDGSPFLKGFQNLRQKEKQIEQARNQQIIKLTPLQYDPSILEPKQTHSYNFIPPLLEEESLLSDLLTSRQPSRAQRQSERLGQRLANNVMIQNRPIQVQERTRVQMRVQESQKVERLRNPVIRNIPKSRQRCQIPKPNDIRIRNIGPIRGQSQAHQSTHSRQKSQKKSKREEIGFMIQTLIGRKLK